MYWVGIGVPFNALLLPYDDPSLLAVSLRTIGETSPFRSLCSLDKDVLTGVYLRRMTELCHDFLGETVSVWAPLSHVHDRGLGILLVLIIQTFLLLLYFGRHLQVFNIVAKGLYYMFLSFLVARPYGYGA